MDYYTPSILEYSYRRSVIRDCVDINLLRSNGLKVTVSVSEILEKLQEHDKNKISNPVKYSPIENLFR